MNIAETLLIDFDAEMQSTRRLLERIPNEVATGTYRPHEKSMPMGRLAAHVSTLARLGIAILTTPSLAMEPGSMPPLVFESTEKLLADFDALSKQARDLLEKTTDHELLEHWSLTFKGTILAGGSRALMFRTMFFNHMIHHRAQLTVYLRLNNVPVPGLYGPSADET